MILSLVVFSIGTPIHAQMDTHPPNHKDYAEQMRLPFFLFAEDFREVCITHGGFDVVTTDGDRWQIRRWGSGFIAETDSTPRRRMAEYSPFVLMGAGQDFQWMARYADGSTDIIRRDRARSYSDAGGGRFTRR